MLGQSEYNVLVDNRAASKITQGITTEITGEGSSIAPINQRMIDEGKEVYEHYGVKPTWTTLREYWRAFETAAAGDQPRHLRRRGRGAQPGGRREMSGRRPPPSSAAMEKAVAQAMEDGAFGLSTSLQYVPDRFASTEEIIALAKVAARYGGSYITHQRSEQYQIDASLDEIFRIAREAKLPGADLSPEGRLPGNVGKDAARPAATRGGARRGPRRLGRPVPWTAGRTASTPTCRSGCATAAPTSWSRASSDPAVRARVRAELRPDDRSWENQYQCAGGGKGVLIATVVNPALKKYEGKTVAEIAKAESKDQVDVIMDLVVADRAHTSNIIFIMDEQDVRTALRQPARRRCAPTRAPRPRTASSARRSLTRGPGPRRRASSATTCATSTCCRSRRRSAR